MIQFFHRMFEGWGAMNRAPTAEQAERMRRQKYVNVFSTPDGQWVLADMARMHNVLQETFPNPDITPTMIALNEGGRSAIVNIIKYVEQPTEIE